MIYNFKKFFEDHAVPYSGPNSRSRYELPCYFPDCGSSSGKYIASIHIESQNTINCYKCGARSLNEVVPYMTGGQNWDDIKYNYKLEKNARDLLLQQNKPETVYAESVKLPKGDKGLNDRAYQYLYKRSFSPNEIVEKYNIYSTNHIGNYKFRIIIPIYFDHKLISYQGRDYTGLVPKEKRYKSCKKEDETFHYKHMVYNIDNAKEDYVIIVEGPFDVFTLGDNTVCTFGIGYTTQQINLISKRFKKAFILYDPGTDAQKQANKLGGELSGLGLEVKNINLKSDKDPGDLSTNEANYLKKKILRGI